VLRQKSPLSVAVTMAQLGRGATLDLAACLAMEYRMVHHFLADSDFAEGSGRSLSTRTGGRAGGTSASRPCRRRRSKPASRPARGDLFFDWIEIDVGEMISPVPPRYFRVVLVKTTPQSTGGAREDHPPRILLQSTRV
jgi:hypothetical protein